jgi:hypothetical protein
MQAAAAAAARELAPLTRDRRQPAGPASAGGLARRQLRLALPLVYPRGSGVYTSLFRLGHLARCVTSAHHDVSGRCCCIGCSLPRCSYPAAAARLPGRRAQPSVATTPPSTRKQSKVPRSAMMAPASCAGKTSSVLRATSATNRRPPAPLASGCPSVLSRSVVAACSASSATPALATSGMAAST